MEDSLRSLLEEWKVSSNYIDKLNDQEVWDISTLLLLTDEQVREIFDKVGSRANFLRNLKQLQCECGRLTDLIDEFTFMTPDDLTHVALHILVEEYGNMNPATPKATGSGSESMGLESTGSASTGSTGLEEIPESNLTSHASTLAETEVTENGNGSRTRNDKAMERQSPPSRKRRPTCNLFEFDLENLLSSCLKGKEVLAYFKENKDLNESNRNKLADVLLNEYLKEDHNKKLPSDVENDMADAVVEFFDCESKDTWVSESTCKREKSEGRGFIIKRYYHIRRGLRNSGVIVSTSKPKSDSFGENIEDGDEIKEMLSWLEFNKQPWAKLIDYWKATANSRLRDHIGGTESIASYMDKYIALKDKCGYLLLETDFESRFGNANNFYTQWPMFSAFVEKRAPAKIKQAIEDCLTPEGKKIQTILGLAYLFSTITVARNKQKTYRPSNEVVSECLLLMVKTVGDIKPALAARLKRYEPFHLKLSPQAILVGNDEDSILKSFVRINEVLYEVENPLKVLDITFKSMHVLDTQYPEECKREFLFLERAIYNINANKKGLPATVSSLVSDFVKFKTRSA